MPTAHCVSTVTGIIRSVDAGFCALMQRPGAELVGASYRTITVAEDIPKSAQMLSGLVDTAAPIRLRKRYRRPDGSVVEADLLVSRLAESDDLVSTISWREPRSIGDPAGISPRRMWQAALHVQHLYRCRMEELGAELFGDFVGAILIQTYLSEAEGRVVGVDAIAGAIGLDPGTTRRWARALWQRDLLQPVGAPADTVQLTHLGLTKVERLLTAVVEPVDPPAACPPRSG